MINRIVLFLLFIPQCGILLNSCGSGKGDAEGIPPLDEIRFVNVLTDVRLLEGTYTLKYQRMDSAGDILDIYYKQIWEKHGIKQSDFEQSYVLYAKDAAKMESLEDSVLHRLEKENERLISDRKE